MSYLLSGCFAVLNIATNSYLIQSHGVILKTSTTFIRTNSLQLFKQQHEYLCQ